jgi:hypothetical protein
MMTERLDSEVEYDGAEAEVEAEEKNEESLKVEGSVSEVPAREPCALEPRGGARVFEGRAVVRAFAEEGTSGEFILPSSSFAPTSFDPAPLDVDDVEDSLRPT